MKQCLTFALIALTLLAACGGKPAVPDEQQPRDYASTKDDGSTAEPTTMKPIETQSADAPKATGPIATINGKEIGSDEFNTEVERGVAKGMQPGLLRQLKDRLVEQIIDRTLIEGAIEDAGIKVSDAELAAKLDEVRAEFAKASAAMGQGSTLEEATAAMGIGPDELKESLVQAVAIEKMLAKRGFVAPDDAKVEAFYEDNKMRFERPEQVRLLHILIKVEKADDQAAWDTAQKKAEMVRAQAAKKDADFAKLAADNSQGPMAQQGGDLGFRERGVLPEEVDAAAFQMKVGELSKPIKSAFGWHILKLEDKNEAGIVPFEEIKDQLQSQLKTQAANEALAALVEELRKNSEISLHPENIK